MQKIILTTLLACMAFSFSHAQRTASSADVLKLVSTEYNKRINLWDKPENYIDINKIELISPKQNNSGQTLGILKKEVTGDPVNPIIKPVPPANAKMLEEVSVNGYITQKGGDPTIEYTVLKQKDFKDMATTNVADLIQGKVAGAEVIKSSGDPLASSQITIHGVSSLNLVNPLYIIDGVIQPTSGAGSNINPNDIASITVVKDAAGCAIYGSAAAGGVIIVNTKTGKEFSGGYSSLVTLKSMEDVDYIESIQNAAKDNLYARYLSLEPEYRHNMNFYLDMSMYFFEQGVTEHINEMLNKASAISDDYNEDYQSQLALAYVCEYTKFFDKAINIYTKLHESYGADLRITRNLAWAYFESNRYDTAVNILYNGIIATGDDATNRQTIKMKDIMLADLNMIIALHKDSLDISYIPKEIIKSVPADMRIIMEINNSGFANLTVSPSHKHTIDFNAPVNNEKDRIQIASDDYSVSEFTVQNATGKKYSFSVPYIDNQKGEKKPILVRIIKLKDFGKPTQSIDMDLANLGNQSGTITFDAFKISK